MLATELRKNLFQTLEKASQGDPVMIEYKGVSLRLEATGRNSKLAGAIRRNAIIGDPDALIGPDQDLLSELDAKWAAEDAKL
jgi:hypothetical protein